MILLDVDIFVQRRKELHVSQESLAKGVCTQATLSKLENNLHVPSMAILEKLCEKLNLNVEDLYRSSKDESEKIELLLNNAERNLMMENYLSAMRYLKSVSINDVKNNTAKMQYYFLHGLVKVLTNDEMAEAFMDFYRITEWLDEEHKTVFIPLSYTGIGIVYLRSRKVQNAKFFFLKVHEFLLRHLKKIEQKSIFESNLIDDLRILCMLFYTAEFLTIESNYDMSNELIVKGLQLCSSKRATYYVPRLKLLQAENEISQHKNISEVQNILDEALAFGKLNHDDLVQVKVGAFRRKLNI